MWIRNWGPVNERLDLLGTEKSCVYLLKGDRYALLGGGGQWIVPVLEQQLRSLSVDMERISHLVISHAHFDHCAAVPYLQKRYPHIEVVATPGAAQLLGHEKAVRNMRLFSREATARIGMPMEFEGRSLEFDGIALRRTWGDGDDLNLGAGVRLVTFETPGHSRCSMIAFEPDARWLFPGDSLPPPSQDGQSLLATASESFVAYIASLKKLEKLETELCGWEHHGVRTGEDARGIVRKAIEFTVEYKEWVVATLREAGDPELAARVVADRWLAQAGFPFLSDAIMLHIARGIVKNAREEVLPA